MVAAASTEQHAEFWPGRRIVRSVRRYAVEELVGGGLPSRVAERVQDHACNKYAVCARTISAGLFTAVCGSCYRLLGFSMMEQAESPRIPFEIALCLDWENGFGQWQDAEGGRDPCARAQGGNVQPQASDA